MIKNKICPHRGLNPIYVTLNSYALGRLFWEANDFKSETGTLVDSLVHDCKWNDKLAQNLSK